MPATLRHRIVSTAVGLTAIVGLASTATAVIDSSSPTYTVPASIDATGGADVTTSLNDFLASVPDGATVSFPAGGQYRVEGTIWLRGRHNLTVDGNGARFFATTDGRGAQCPSFENCTAWPRNRYHWAVREGSDITLRELVIRGGHPNAGMNGDYIPELEAQHGVDVGGVDGIVLDGLTITDVYGDFVHLSAATTSSGRTWTRNAVVRNSRMERNGRQGISLIAVDDAVIDGNYIADTRRSTFDIEPEREDLGATDVLITRNTIGQGRLRFIAAGGAPALIARIDVVGNHLDRRLDIVVQARTLGVRRRGPFRVENNTSTVAVDPPDGGAAITMYETDGLTVRNNNIPFRDSWLTQYGVKTYSSCGVLVESNEFPNADGVVVNESPASGCTVPTESTTTTAPSTSSTSTTSTSTTSTTAPPAASSTTVTDVFSGGLNRKHSSREHYVVAQAGPLTNGVEFTRDRSLRLQVFDAAGQLLQDTEGASPLAPSALNVPAGTYRLVVSGSTRASYTVRSTHM